MSDTDTVESPDAPSRDPFLDLDIAEQYIRLWRFRARIEYVLLGVIAITAVSIAVGFIALDVGVEDVQEWGYPALWLISGLRAASVLLPIPGSGLTFAAGAIMEPFMGIPAPIMVGITAGSAESLGEFTGYAAGYGGGRILDKRRLYHKIKAWIQKRAFLTVLVMSLTPSPLFDVAGLAAGASRVPIRVFWPAVLIGKVVRGIAMAAAGYYGFEIAKTIL
jgi:uncharacterized membrane protein YdjX (TVP38/TMEM64 family)